MLVYLIILTSIVMNVSSKVLYKLADQRAYSIISPVTGFNADSALYNTQSTLQLYY